MAARIRAATPVGSCPDCLSWGASYGSQSYCRACYDFTRRYGRGRCGGCARVIAVKKGHCRLCWLQAGIAAGGRRRLSAEDFAATRYWQLSLAGMSRLGSTGPARQAPPDGPAPPDAAPGWTQLQLSAPGQSLHFDKRHWAASAINGPALQQARHIAAGLAATRGWNGRIITETSRALAVVLAGHQPGDMIGWSQLPAALHRRDLSITRTAEILQLAGLLDDDRIPSFTSLTQERLALLPAPMAASVRDWLRTRSQGGPRSRPRDEHTVRMNLNRVHPLLLAWTGHYVHLREVTAADVTAATEPLPPTRRRQTLTAEIDQATSAAITPAGRLAVALAAIHAARPKTIRELHLDDADLGNRRLVLTGQARPLDDLTKSLLLAWLQHRGHRWPGTANPHLIINQQTAMTTRAVSENWLTESCRGLTATLERLRVDRQLEEALTCGADPLHLAAVFGIDDTTAIKYATIARQLLATAAEQHHPAGSREPKDPDRP
jgi:hypothetical protein